MTIRTYVLPALAGTLLLAGCVQPGATGPNNTQSGAIAGGLLGAGIGAIAANDSGKGAVIGALVGSAAGGIIGNTLDRQAAELQQELDSRIRIVNEGNQLRVIMPNGILFETGSAVVNPAINQDIVDLANNLNRYPNSRVEVIGHTDSDGPASYNMQLSQRRADSVGALLRQAGVAPGRIVTIGRGEDQPVADNLTEAGRQQNRRVEVLIIPTS